MTEIDLIVWVPIEHRLVANYYLCSLATCPKFKLFSTHFFSSLRGKVIFPFVVSLSSFSPLGLVKRHFWALFVEIILQCYPDPTLLFHQFFVACSVEIVIVFPWVLTPPLGGVRGRHHEPRKFELRTRL